MATVYDLTQIANNDAFRSRVRYLSIKAAVAKANDVNPTPADIALVLSILSGVERLDAWVLGALTNPTIAAGAHVSPGHTIADNDLEFSVNSLWSAFAKGRV